MSSCCSRKVMCRAALAPAVYEFSCAAGEACSHVGIAEGKDQSFLVHAFSRNELEVSVSVLSDRKISNRAGVRIELCQISAACLAVEYFHDLHGRFLIGNIRVAGSAVADDRDIVVKVKRIHLSQLTCSGDGLQDAHCHGNLDISLYRAGCTLFDQHGERRDQHAVKNACLALCESVVMRSDQAEFLVLNPFLKSHDIFCHFPYFFDTSSALDIEGVEDILCFRADRVLICDIVGDSPHLLPVELLGVKMHSSVQVGLVDIKVHHTRIRSSDLRNIGIAESSSYLSRAAPVFDLRLDSGIPALYNAGDNRMSLAVSLQVGNHLAYSSAGIAFAEPGSDICVVVVKSFQFLNVYKNYRHIQILHCGKHVVGCSVGQKLEEYKVNVCRAEKISRCLGLFLGGNHSAVDDLYCVGKSLLERLILRLEFRHQ